MTARRRAAGAAAMAAVLLAGTAAAAQGDRPADALPPGAVLPVAVVTLPEAEMRFSDSHVALADAGVATPGAAAGLRVAEEGGGALRFTLGTDVLFDFDRAVLRPEAGPILRRLLEEVAARLPAGGAGARVRVEGHTDSIGTDAYNQRLSERRAAAVRAWLAGPGGVPARLIGTAGFGEHRPIAPNTRPDGGDDPEGRQRNRRVEIVVTPRG